MLVSSDVLTIRVSLPISVLRVSGVMHELCLFVSRQFQVLFHSPSGGLFTFPSRYSFTIGAFVYLALEDGSPSFPQDLRVPWYLGIPEGRSRFYVHDFHVLWSAIPSSSTIHFSPRPGSFNPRSMRLRTMTGFRLFRFRSPLLTESQLYLFSSPY